jgi:hypothetical protein
VAKAGRKPKPEGEPRTITFAEDVVEEMLERLRNGEPLTAICKDARMPSTQSVYAWAESDSDFSERFHSARATGVHALAEECLVIADGDAKEAVDVMNKRVRIDTRLRLAGKWLPALYGDKLDLTSGGEKLGLSAELEAARKRVAE